MHSFTGSLESKFSAVHFFEFLGSATRQSLLESWPQFISNSTRWQVLFRNTKLFCEFALLARSRFVPVIRLKWAVNCCPNCLSKLCWMAHAGFASRYSGKDIFDRPIQIRFDDRRRLIKRPKIVDR